MDNPYSINLINNSKNIYEIFKKYNILSEDEKNSILEVQYNFFKGNMDNASLLNPKITFTSFMKTLEEKFCINKDMIIVFSCNKDWYKYLVVNIYSLLKYNKSIKKIYLLTSTNNISDIPHLKDIIETNNNEVEIINIIPLLNKKLKKNCPNSNTIFSDFCFGRLLIPDIIKEEKALYIDTDIIVKKDISNIWKYDISKYYIAGIKDYGILNDDTLDRLQMNNKKYINSGFLLMNLKKIRKDKIVDKWFEIVNSKKLTYPDQDALNLVCTKKELYLPSIYNYNYPVTQNISNENKVKVFHYIGDKIDWIADHFNNEEWYEEAENFHNEFIKQETNNTVVMLCSKERLKNIAISIYSLIKNNKNNINKIYIMTETEDIEKIPNLIDIINIFNIQIILVNYKKQLDIDFSNNTSSLIAKIIIPEIFNEKKIILIDSDVIIKKSISQINTFNLNKNYIAGVKDYRIDDLNYKLEKYINIDFSVWNLEKMRKDKFTEKCIEILKNKENIIDEQEVINIACKGKIQYIPSIYNYILNITKEVLNPKLVKVYNLGKIENEELFLEHPFSGEWYEEKEELQEIINNSKQIH